MDREAKELLHADRQDRLLALVVDGWRWPDGASKWLGRSASIRRFTSHGISWSSAADSSSAPICDSAVLPRICGASHSAALAARAVSDRSGKLSSTRRRNETRWRSASCGFDQGRRWIPSAAMPSASARALSSVGGTASVCSPRLTAPSLRARFARSAAAERSKVTSSRVSIRSAKSASISARLMGAAERMRARAATTADLGHREKGLARQRRGRVDGSATAIGENEIAVLAARPGDAVGKGEGQHRAGSLRPRADVGRRRHLAQPAGRHATRILGPAGAVGAETVEAMAEMHVLATQPTLGDEQREIGGEPPFAAGGRIHHHAAEPRGERQGAQALALLGDAPVGIEPAKAPEQRPRLGHGRLRRWVEKGERSGIGDAPGGAVEQQRGEIGGEDLRRLVGGEGALLCLLPEPVADARLGAAGAAAALVGGRA